VRVNILNIIFCLFDFFKYAFLFHAKIVEPSPNHLVTSQILTPSSILEISSTSSSSSLKKQL